MARSGVGRGERSGDSRRVLLDNAPLALVLVVGVGVLWLLRPGVVTNGARSPVLWLVVLSAVVGARLVGLLVRRLAGRDSAGTAASVAVGLTASYFLLAPSFQQRTLQEPLPVPQPQAATRPVPTVPATPATAASPPRPPTVGASGQAAAVQPAVPTPASAAASAPATPTPPARVVSRPPSTAPVAPSAPRQLSSARLRGVGHSASGRTAFYEVEGEAVLRFESVDIEGAPGPVVHLVRPGARTPGEGVRVGKLKAEKGTFSYRLPSTVDPRQRWTVLVWCEPYDTPIAAADH